MYKYKYLTLPPLNASAISISISDSRKHQKPNQKIFNRCCKGPKKDPQKCRDTVPWAGRRCWSSPVRRARVHLANHPQRCRGRSPPYCIQRGWKTKYLIQKLLQDFKIIGYEGKTVKRTMKNTHQAKFIFLYNQEWPIRVADPGCLSRIRIFPSQIQV